MLPSREILNLAFAFLAPLMAGQGTATELPRVAVETFPPAAQSVLQQAYERARSNPRDGEAAGALGRALQAWEQWESAHQAYARAHALAPRTFDWPYLDAVVLQRLARQREAADSLRQALAVNPKYLAARVKLAEALLEAGDLDESRKLFEALSAEPSAQAGVQVGLGRIAAAEGRHGDAVRHFERAIELFPQLGAAHYAVARSYRALGRTADAERALARHAESGARWPPLDDPVLAAVSRGRDDPRALLQRGVSLAETGNVDAAITAFEEALERDPSLAQAHANLISLYGRARNWAKAEEHFQRAVALGFQSADAQYDYGLVLSMQEKWDAAEAAYRQALALNPLHPQAHNNLGQLLERPRSASATDRTAALNAAAAEYAQALEAQPSFRLARFNLGRMMLALGRNDEALAEFNQLQTPVDAETPRYVFALSTAEVRAGRKDEGVRLANEARRMALEFGQTDLAAAIDRALATLR